MYATTVKTRLQGTSPRRLASALAVAASVALAASAQAAIYVYDNDAIGTSTITETTVANCISGGRPITFTVPDTFNVSVNTGTVGLGLRVTHTDREQIHAILRAPTTNKTATVITGVDNGSDGPNNYDLIISTYNLGNINDGDADPTAAPFYNRLAYTGAATTFDTFNGDPAKGTWTLFLCDVDPDAVTGNVLSARLVLSDSQSGTAGEVCSEKVTYEWCNAPACDGTVFPGAGVNVTADVSLFLQNSTAIGGANNGGWDQYTPSFARQDEQLGAHTGFYLAGGMNITAAGVNAEGAAMVTTWDFRRSGSPIQVSGLEWLALDVDYSNSGNTFRDLLRADGFTGAAGAGTAIPYVQTLQNCNAAAGDIVLGTCEIPHANPGTSGANPTRRYLRGVASVGFGYTASEDITPNIQYIGIGDPSFCVYDFGDAPDTYGTVSATTAARHVLGQRNLYLGSSPPDGELTGKATADATGDNTFAAVPPLVNLSDEGGVAFPAVNLSPGSTYTVTGITVNNGTSATARLCGWIDFDINGGAQDGTFETDERSCITVPASGSNASCTGAGTTFTCSMSWTVPADFVYTNSATFARFRLATVASEAESPTGFANSGEVEDYQIPAGTLPVTLAWVESSAGPRGLEVRWMTSMEDRNGGFRIWGLDAKGERRLLGFVPSLVVDSFAPQSYEASFAAPGIVSIEIEDLALDGKNRLHGPFGLGKSAGERPTIAPFDWAAIRAELAPAAERAAQERTPWISDAQSSGSTGSSTTVAILKVREEGIQRVTFEELIAAGVDLTGIPGNRISLFDGGQAVPRYVSAAGSFGPGEFVEFLARPRTTLESPFDAFELRVDRRPRQNPPAVAGGAGAPVVVTVEDRHRPDLRFSPSAPNGDPWYDVLLLGRPGIPAQATRAFDLPDLAAGPVELTVDLWGYSYFGDAAPDHHVVVRLNGQEIANELFDGLTPWSRTVDVTALVQATGNQLRVEIPGDVPYVFDVVNLEGFTVRYPRQSVALDSRFHYPGGAAAKGIGAGYAVDGFGASNVVAWLSGGGQLSRGELAPVAGRVVVANAQAEAFLADSTAVWTPEIEAGAPVRAYSSRARYVILTHPAFAADLGPLVALQESRGFTTEVVTVDRIFAAYSDHAPSAEALREFLAASKKNLRYVLIVGAASSDPWDHLGTGSISFVPTAYLPVVADVSFSPTDEAIVDLDGDRFPDVPIGRLPVRTPAEVQNAIAKLQAWEANVVGSAGALLVAGASDSERTLATINEAYRDALASWPTSLAQVDDLGTPTVRQQTIAGMNAGVPLVSFVGHSSASVWDFDPVLRWQDVDAFTNAGRPSLVTQWGCWSSYYVEPNYECMSGRMMNVQSVGAAATIGASTLTSEASHRRLGQLFFQQVSAGVPRLGDAFLRAKRALRLEGAPGDAILGMMLLGDPAMPLPVAVH